MKTLLSFSSLMLGGYLTFSAHLALADQTSSACNNGVCAGLGHAFYLRDINLLDPTAQTSRRQILLNTALGTCATKTPSGSSRKDFQSYESATSAINAWSGGISTSGSGISAAISAFSLAATASANYDSSSLKTTDAASVSLDYVLLDAVVDLNQNAACWSRDNLTPEFLSAFEALPVNDPQWAAEASSWADYRVFLQSWGSHVQVKQELGSRLQILESEKTTDQVDTQTLKAKVCFSLGYAAVNVPVCGDYNTTQKNTASTRDTVEKIYIAGGSRESRNKLIAASAGQFSSEDVSAFINSAGTSDQPIGFKYRPVWELLMDVYRAACVTAKDANACQHFQRAVNLQAAYEGFLAYDCILNRTASADPTKPGLFVQGMVALPANGNGIVYYACKQTKAGCSNDNDCNAGTGGSGWPWDPKWQQCFCEGSGCISTQLIAGTTQYRSIIKNREPDKSKANSNVGVNDSCRDDSSCTCNTAWAGGEQEREIWNQATGGSGSGSFTGVKSIRAASASSSTESDMLESPETYTISVRLKNPTPRTDKQEKSQFDQAKEVRNDAGTLGYQVMSTDSLTTIECPGRCSGVFSKGSQVTLEARKRVGGQTFKEWSKNTCFSNRGTGRICTITNLNGNVEVEAIYE
jgi:MAC/Perforin domain.